MLVKNNSFFKLNYFNFIFFYNFINYFNFIFYYQLIKFDFLNFKFKKLNFIKKNNYVSFKKSYFLNYLNFYFLNKNFYLKNKNLNNLNYKNLINILYNLNINNYNYLIFDNNYKYLYNLYYNLYSYNILLKYKKYFFINSNYFTHKNWIYFYNNFLLENKICMLFIFDFFKNIKYSDILLNLNVILFFFKNDFLLKDVDYMFCLNLNNLNKFYLLLLINNIFYLSLNIKNYNNKLRYFNFFKNYLN